MCLRKSGEEKQDSIDSQRQSAVGRAMRSEKIRTYNYPQNRITDHRINQSFHQLDKTLEGDLQPILTALKSTPPSL